LSILFSMYTLVSKLAHTYLSKKKMFSFHRLKSCNVLQLLQITPQKLSHYDLQQELGIRCPIFLIFKANSSNMLTFYVCLQKIVIEKL
jgi:hypothetical protein